MTKREAIRVVREALLKRGVNVRSVRHVYPRAYVLAKVASHCIVVAVPVCYDCEPQLRSMTRPGYDWIREGDVTDLATGDWCICAYVSTPTGGMSYAIRIPTGDGKNNVGRRGRSSRRTGHGRITRARKTNGAGHQQRKAS